MDLFLKLFIFNQTPSPDRHMPGLNEKEDVVGPEHGFSWVNLSLSSVLTHELWV